MTPSRLCLPLLIAFFALYSWPCLSEDNQDANEPTQRLCKNEDLVNHAFKMVDFRETPPRGEALMVQEAPYQFLTFYEKNGYDAMAFNMELNSKQVISYLKAYSGGKYYILSKDGVLNLVDNDKIKYSYRCVAQLKKQYEYIPGDLILTGYTKKGKSVLYKLYRRWY